MESKRFPSFKKDRSKSIDYGALRKKRDKVDSIELAGTNAGEDHRNSGPIRDFAKNEDGVCDVLDFDSLEWKEKMKVQLQKNKERLSEIAKKERMEREVENEKMAKLLSKRRNSQPEVEILKFATKEEEEEYEREQIREKMRAKREKKKASLYGVEEVEDDIEGPAVNWNPNRRNTKSALNVDL